MTLAIWKPGYLETLIEPSSAALNLTCTLFKARVIALLMAVLAVRPKPRREYVPASHMKCHPAFLILRSSVEAIVSPADDQVSSNFSCTRSRPSGNKQPVRRNIECCLTPAAFWLSMCTPNGQNHSFR